MGLNPVTRNIRKGFTHGPCKEQECGWILVPGTSENVLCTARLKKNAVECWHRARPIGDWMEAWMICDWSGIEFLYRHIMARTSKLRTANLLWRTRWEIFSRFCKIKPKSDCIHYFPIYLEQNGSPFAVLNQSENEECDLISVWFNKIQKLFIWRTSSCMHI